MKRGAWLLTAAIAAYFLGVAVWVRYDRRSAREVFEPGSVFSTDSEGLSLAYSYLREKAGRRGAVATLHTRADPESLPARAVLFRVQPSVVPFLPRVDEFAGQDGDEKDKKDDKEKKAGGEEEGGERATPLLTQGEEAWVRAGGRLVLAIGQGYGPLAVEPVQGRPAVRKVFPLWPGVSELRPAGRAVLTGRGLAGAHSVILLGEAPVVARSSVGAGEVFLLSCPEVLQNRLLGKADHLALLEALAGVQEGEGGRPVFFDERAHGLGEAAGIAETLGDWGLGPLLLLAVLAAASVFWRASVRIGPPDREDRDTRSEAVELLDSLADLYDRALGRTDALRLYHDSFVQTVAADTGLRGPALEARTRQILDAAGGVEPLDGDLSRDRFDRALATLNQAFGRLQDAKRK